jgi:hypothetical protein
MEPHKFERLGQTTQLCKLCYKPKLHENHLDFLTDEDKISSEAQNKLLGISLCAKPGITEDTQLIDGESKLPLTMQKQDENLPDCYGHICPGCGQRWDHNYKCWPGTKESLYCGKCMSQANVEINRPKDIDLIAQSQSHVLSNRDIAEKFVEKEQFWFLELTRQADYEDWFANVFWKDLQAKIEMLRIDQAAGKQALLKRRTLDLEKLTPEEIDTYKRRASRQKDLKSKSEVKSEKDDYKTNLAKLIKMVGNEDAAKLQLAEIYKLQGKEIPKNDL